MKVDLSQKARENEQKEKYGLKIISGLYQAKIQPQKNITQLKKNNERSFVRAFFSQTKKYDSNLHFHIRQMFWKSNLKIIIKSNSFQTMIHVCVCVFYVYAADTRTVDFEIIFAFIEFMYIMMYIVDAWTVMNFRFAESSFKRIV